MTGGYLIMQQALYADGLTPSLPTPAATVDRKPLRSMRERVLQALAFEAGGLLLVAPLYALVFQTTAHQSITLLLVLSVMVLTWSPLHNSLFDVVELRLTGRSASERPHSLRLVHAASLEITAVAFSLPAVMWLGGHDLYTALAVDVGLTLAYAIYAYGFHIVYDRLVPVGAAAAA
jgi:uncharacterized membrane protein